MGAIMGPPEWDAGAEEDPPVVTSDEAIDPPCILANSSFVVGWGSTKSTDYG